MLFWNCCKFCVKKLSIVKKIYKADFFTWCQVKIWMSIVTWHALHILIMIVKQKILQFHKKNYFSPRSGSSKLLKLWKSNLISNFAVLCTVYCVRYCVSFDTAPLAEFWLKVKIPPLTWPDSLWEVGLHVLCWPKSLTACERLACMSCADLRAWLPVRGWLACPVLT